MHRGTVFQSVLPFYNLKHRYFLLDLYGTKIKIFQVQTLGFTIWPLRDLDKHMILPYPSFSGASLKAVKKFSVTGVKMRLS